MGDAPLMTAMTCDGAILYFVTHEPDIMTKTLDLMLKATLCSVFLP